MLLLSIHPRFVALLLSGKKTVELRRQVPRRTVTRLAIYATLPDAALQAVADIEAVETASPEEIWERYRDQVGITQQEYDAYFDGAESATAITLSGVTQVPAPIRLADLRKLWPGFHPPQGFRYLASAVVERLRQQLGPTRS